MKTPQILIEELLSEGITQTEIALATGLSNAYVNELKKGKRKNPTYDSVQSLISAHRELMKLAKMRNRILRKTVEA